MSNSQQLLNQYGTTIHCDCTFGCLLAGHKVMGTGVIDGEGHSRLASVSIAPGHTKADWLEMFKTTQCSYIINNSRWRRGDGDTKRTQHLVENNTNLDLSQDKIKYTQQLALGTCLTAIELKVWVKGISRTD